MDRISTSSQYNGVLINLMNAENQQATIGNQISSLQMSTDLQGYSTHAETLTALQTLQAQVTGYLSNASITANELTTQDTALTQLGNAATAATKAVNTAIATGNGDTLMQALQGAFQNAVQSLNSTNNGAFVFSGGNSNTPPVSVSTLTALVSAPSVASVFTNAQHVTTTQFTSTLSVPTGFLADQLGTPLFTVMQQIAAFDQGPNGPLSGNLTTAQQTFLEGEVSALNSAGTGITSATAQNGEAQSELSNSQTDLGNQQTTLQGLIGNITNVDLGKASSDLSQAQLAVQASSRVFEALQSSSLMAVLTASGH